MIRLSNGGGGRRVRSAASLPRSGPDGQNDDPWLGDIAGDDHAGPVRRQHTQALRAALVACESPFVRRWALFVQTSFPLLAAGGIVSYRIVSYRIAAR
jgi:hypothetical protein